MTVINFADLQSAWRAKQHKNRRDDLRRYLIGGEEPSSAAYQTVSRRLYAEGGIDNLGLADSWLAVASERERAALFSEIATAFLKV